MRDAYPIGARIYKEFPSYGCFWGTITACIPVDKNDADGMEYYYDVAYRDGDMEMLDHQEIQAYIHEERRTSTNNNLLFNAIAIPVTSLPTSTTRKADATLRLVTTKAMTAA
jgi:hypothetical protein